MKTKLEIINMVNNLPPGSTELSNCYNVYVYRLCGMADNSNFLLFQIFGLDAYIDSNYVDYMHCIYVAL